MTWNPFKERCPGLAYLAPLLDAAKSRMAAAPFRDCHIELILMFAFFFLFSFYYIECPSWQGTRISQSFATGTRRTLEVCFLEAPWPDWGSNSGLESDGHSAMSPDQQSQIIIIIIKKRSPALLCDIKAVRFTWCKSLVLFFIFLHLFSLHSSEWMFNALLFTPLKGLCAYLRLCNGLNQRAAGDVWGLR